GHLIERRAQRDGLQQVLKAVAARGELLRELSDEFRVTLLQGRCDAVAVDTPHQAGRQRRVIMQRLAQAGGVAEGLAVQAAAGVDRDTLFGLAIGARPVEVFEREADRVGDAVTAGADRILKVHAYALARGLRR